MSNRVQELFESNIKRVTRAFEKNAEISAIAKKVGVSAPTVAKWLTSEGYRRKKKGRIPLAMKARVRDLAQRGWEPAAIGSLLELSEVQVDELSKPESNPIVKSLKVKAKKGKPRRDKKDKKRSRLDKGENSPPPKHKCGKRWTLPEESYVLTLIEAKVAPGAIYKRMRASRARQLKIWRKNGGEGLPPNFPPPKDGAADFADRLPVDRSGARERAAVEDQCILELEKASAARQAKIQELEEAADAERHQIHLLEIERKQLVLERVEREARLARQGQAVAALGDQEPRRRRERQIVQPGSYEHEVLKLEPGSYIDGPPQIGRPKNPEPSSYADNGEYFVVSNDWADLDDAEPDELSVFAHHLTSKGFPARVASSGDQPDAHFESLWPKALGDKWMRAVDGGLRLLRDYQERRDTLAKKKMETKGIVRYLVYAYRENRDLPDAWGSLSQLDRLILVFSMGAAYMDGTPTQHGVELGRNVSHRLEAKRERETAKATKRTMRASEEDDIRRSTLEARARRTATQVVRQDDEEDEDADQVMDEPRRASEEDDIRRSMLEARARRTATQVVRQDEDEDED